MINVVAEHTRGHLKKMVFSDPKLKIDDQKHEQNNFLERDYFQFSSIESDYKELSQATKTYSNGQARSKHYQEILDEKINRSTSSQLFSKLFQTILSAEYQTFSFLVENKDVMHEIMSQLIKKNIRPKVLVQENEYFLLTIPEYNISFLNLRNYLPFEMHDLIDMYNLKLSYPIFPFEILTEGKFDITTLPTFEKYTHYTDTHEIKKSKKKAYDKLATDQVFCFQKALLDYSNQKILIFAQSVFYLLHSLFLMQQNLISYFKTAAPVKGLAFFSPFTTPCCTLAGFNYTIFKYFGLNHPIYALQKEFGQYQYNCSKLELEYVLYYTHKFGEDRCYSPYTPKGVRRFQNYTIPDIATDNWAGWFMGCAVHGHINCPNMPDSTIEKKNMYNITYGHLNNIFNAKMKKVAEEFPGVTQHVMWECEWKILRAVKDSDLYNFLKNIFSMRPEKRMSIRDCVKGGISECYSHYFNSAKSKNQVLRVEDAVSCYPTEMLRQVFPIGKPITIIGDALQYLEYRNGQFYFQDRKCWGAVQVQYEVPKNTLRPYLVFKNNKTAKIPASLANCFQCSTTQTRRLCTHSSEKRRFTQTITLADCGYLFELGYDIVKYFEALLYFEAAKIFEEYLKFTSRHKICSSALPKNMSKESYCEKVNNEMGFSDSLKILPEMLIPNKQIKYIYKTMENSLFGKFSQTSKQVKFDLVDTDKALGNAFCDLDLINYFILSEDIAQIIYKTKPPKICLSTNSLISGYILSYSKISMHKRMELISDIGKVFHYSTDQLIYSWPKSTPTLFENVEIYGYLRNVHENQTVLGFCAMGPYYYTLLIRDDTSGAIETIVKYRGINSTSVIAKEFFNFGAITQQFLNFIRSVVGLTTQIPQAKRKARGGLLQDLEKEFTWVTLNNEVRSRRVIQKKTKNYDTVPFGYNNK